MREPKHYACQDHHAVKRDAVDLGASEVIMMTFRCGYD